MARAVEDIRDILAEPADTGGGGVVGAIGEKLGLKKPSSSGNKGMERTLQKLNSAIDALPSRIQTAVSTAEITIGPNT